LGEGGGRERERGGEGVGLGSGGGKEEEEGCWALNPSSKMPFSIFFIVLQYWCLANILKLF